MSPGAILFSDGPIVQLPCVRTLTQKTTQKTIQKTVLNLPLIPGLKIMVSAPILFHYHSGVPAGHPQMKNE